MAQPEAKQIHYNRWYTFVGPGEMFKGRIKSMGGVTAHVDVNGRERVVDVTAYAVYPDLINDGVLETRLLWSRWTLEVKIERGRVVGSITGQSAKTVPYTTMLQDRVFCVDPLWMLTKTNHPEAPDTAEKILCQMMHKWRRYCAKATK